MKIIFIKLTEESLPTVRQALQSSSKWHKKQGKEVSIKTNPETCGRGT